MVIMEHRHGRRRRRYHICTSSENCEQKRHRMMHEIPAKPNKAGAGTCTEGILLVVDNHAAQVAASFHYYQKVAHKGIFEEACG